MEENILITLEGLLSVIDSSDKDIKVNLFNEQGLLLITFILKGYECLDDFLEDDEVTKIEIVNNTTLNITIDTSRNTNNENGED